VAEEEGDLPMTRLVAFFAVIVGGVAAAIAFLRMLFKPREEKEWQDVSRPGKVVAVDGVAIHYVENSPPNADFDHLPNIVMIHGFGGHTFSFRHQLAEFGKDHRTVAIDLKGFGYSERSQVGSYSLTDQSRLVMRTMDVLGIERAILIGHSMGGEVAMRVAEMAPERVEKLILAASVSSDRVPVAPRLGIYRPFLRVGSRLVAASAWRRMFYDRSKLDLKAIRDGYLAPARIRGSTDTVWAMWKDLKADRPIDFSRITAPVLILWAERERIIPFAARTLARLRKHFPKAEVVTVPRTGHLLLEENPDYSNAAIRRFISGATAIEPATADLVAEPA
jgi:pimeloyl-ACP methyl ester carboxylesterase